MQACRKKSSRFLLLELKEVRILTSKETLHGKILHNLFKENHTMLLADFVLSFGACVTL